MALATALLLVVHSGRLTLDMRGARNEMQRGSGLIWTR
jgi:hypothetical protein